MESPIYADSGQTAVRAKTPRGQEKEGKEKLREVLVQVLPPPYRKGHFSCT